MINEFTQSQGECFTDEILYSNDSQAPAQQFSSVLVFLCVLLQSVIYEIFQFMTDFENTKTAINFECIWNKEV